MVRRAIRSASAAATVLALALAPAAPAGADQDTDARRLLERADAVAAEVSKLRGLTIRRPIRRGIMNRTEIRERLRDRLDHQYDDGEIEAESAALVRLGLLEPDDDYEDLVVALLTDQIAGFYDPWDRRLYLASWSGAAGDMLMAHEIDHALQDQHFNLRRFMKSDTKNGDAAVARQALVEGDGTAVMLEYLMAERGHAPPWGDDKFARVAAQALSGSVGAGSLGEAPLALRENLVFPYRDGLAFVAYFRKHHPWSRIDRIYDRPPLSTEHILHPARYDRYEKPDRVAARATPSTRVYARIYDDVSGELGLSILLRAHGVPARKASTAAAGWGGDRLVVYAPPSTLGGIWRDLAVSYSVWDHEADAIEFFEAAALALPSLAGGRRARLEDDLAAYETRSGDIVALERRGDAVVLVVGALPGHADALRDQVFERWQVTCRR